MGAYPNFGALVGTLLEHVFWSEPPYLTMGAQVGASLELLLQNVVPHHHKDKLKGQVPQSHHLKLEIF